MVDTLARSSGAGEANSATDMSIVRERIDMLRRASNGGTVLVVAPSTKGDTDARGSSVIEDDADFVLHVDLKDGTQHVKVAKQKDGRSGHTVRLAVAQREVGEGGTTLVLREPGKGSTPLVSPEDSTRDRILGVLLEQHGLDAKTQADLVATRKEMGREVTRQAVGKALKTLVAEGSVVPQKRVHDDPLQHRQAPHPAGHAMSTGAPVQPPLQRAMQPWRRASLQARRGGRNRMQPLGNQATQPHATAPPSLEGAGCVAPLRSTTAGISEHPSRASANAHTNPDAADPY